MASSKITSKGQTTVPKEVRDALGLETGSRMVWEIEGRTVKVSPLEAHPFLQLGGSIKTGPGDIAEDIRKAREAWGAERNRRSQEK
ncbi:MAG: type II toxin-antitoxin system PrlF family antitoxin [Acidobacteria bacterium]|nr:type II toxin-antitoxin system PrlF family antitoxin [Acidobacteriota bacterium]